VTSIILSVRVISGDSKEIPWNCIENSTSQNYFSIHFACFSKTNKTLEVTSIILSVRVISWDSKEIPWNCIENSTSQNYFSIHFACFSKTNKTLEVTLKQHFVSSSDGEAIAEPLYRELDLPHFTSRYNFLSKITCLPRNAGRLEVTLMQHFVSSSDFIGFERNPMKSYRELDNPVLLLDTIFYRKSPAYQGTQAGSKWHWSNTLSVRVISWDSKEIPWNRIENST